VIHTMAGTIGATDGWFTNPASQVSAHYGVSLEGEIHQYVALEDRAWANGIREAGNHWPGPNVNPNDLTVSIETEDLGNAVQPVTDKQYAATLAVCKLALARYPSIQWVMGHNAISPSSRPNCPGGRWLQSGMFGQLAGALNLKAVP
jgi:N-acetylmuramoyl-L-alanine amidase